MSHVLIAVGRFYTELADEMVKGAVAELTKHGCTYDVVEVPGAFELPAAVRFGVEAEKYDGYIALGCVIRGDTTHYDYVCGESARGLMDIALHQGAAIGYGILTVENEEQAWVRARITEGNKGRDAAEAALRMIAIKKQFGITV